MNINDLYRRALNRPRRSKTERYSDSLLSPQSKAIISLIDNLIMAKPRKIA